MIQTGNRVRFSYIESPNGQLPPIVDDSTIYMLQDSQQLYVGNNLIAASEVSCDTTAGWAAKSTLVGKAGHVYIYSDHSRTTDGPWECDPEACFQFRSRLQTCQLKKGNPESGREKKSD